MKTRVELFEFLGQLGIATTTHEHAPLRTVEDAQAARGDFQGGHTKNLFLKDKKGGLFLVVADENAAVDLKSLHKRIGAQGRLSFAGAERMRDMLGVEPGAVTAFGLLNDTARAVTLVLDRQLLAHDMVNCHPLENSATTGIALGDLMRFFEATGHQPLIAALAGEPDEAPRIDGVSQEREG